MAELRRDDPSGRVESAFTRIWRTRMEGLPFLNTALREEAVGFRPWQGEWLGALVTPWFYRLGWKEKEKAGKALGPEVLEFPGRRPEPQ